MLSKNSWMYKLIEPSTLNSYIEFRKDRFYANGTPYSILSFAAVKYLRGFFDFETVMYVFKTFSYMKNDEIYKALLKKIKKHKTYINSIEHNREYSLNYYYNHRDQMNEYNRKYLLEHAAEQRIVRQNRYKNNYEKFAKYRKERREHYSLINQELKIKKLNRWIYDPYFGGKCKMCGKKLKYIKSTDPSFLDDRPDFHHTKSEFKKFNIAHMIHSGYSEEEIWNEIKTCDVILVCHKCHLKAHSKYLHINPNDIIKLHDNGMLYKDIANKYNCSVSVLFRCLKNWKDENDNKID